jgi:hypothetical protein
MPSTAIKSPTALCERRLTCRKAEYEGKVIARQSWCDAISAMTVQTWEGVQKLIEDHQAKLTPRKAG